jgi:uncharacterized protein (DUF983 family)
MAEPIFPVAPIMAIVCFVFMLFNCDTKLPLWLTLALALEQEMVLTYVNELKGIDSIVEHKVRTEK